MITAAPGATFPRRRPGTRLEKDADGSGRLVAPDGRVHLLNDTAAALWELCDGSTSTEEMVEAVCVLFRTDPPVVRRDLRRILASLHAVDVLTWERPRGTHG